MSKKVENKNNNRLLTYKQTAVLYFICGFVWIISAFLNYISKNNAVFDFIMGVAFILIGFLFCYKDRKKLNK